MRQQEERAALLGAGAASEDDDDTDAGLLTALADGAANQAAKAMTPDSVGGSQRGSQQTSQQVGHGCLPRLRLAIDAAHMHFGDVLLVWAIDLQPVLLSMQRPVPFMSTPATPKPAPSSQQSVWRGC